MSWKDDRSKKKRENLRAFKKHHYRNISKNERENPSSGRLRPEPEYNQRVLVDIADSSDDKFSFRSNQVVTGWSPLNSDDEEMYERMNAPDFETLRDTPTGNSYTTLSSEKDWETDANSKDEDKNFEKISYFTLNLALINAGLETIPFYKRMDYDSNMFEKQEIKRMNVEAEMAESKYQTVLNTYELNKTGTKENELQNPSKDSVLNAEENLKNEEVDEISNTVGALTVESEKENLSESHTEDKKLDESTKQTPDNTVQEMQEWLDKVLE
ncbi:uncharacterized protein LOC129612648 [Condylostylus longicornis]|uniref:uncharacterized protein LOC129612648 n=1 Tax=Condylostylus longicornis TaxID=2530218 RepID=UPI00244E57D9|nr:uncharacterized protein LOC129612648 [Condylostylus longicornis]